MKKVIKTSVITAVMIFIVACLSLMLICNNIVVNNAKGKIFSEIDSIGNNEVGLLLGTAPNTRIGNRQNYYFYYRIRATEELYKAGKIKKILISGDENSLDGVSEPECMRDSLLAHGVAPEDIILDGKGYRTINSVVRARKVYGFRSFIIISQQFHNERALYQAEHLGLDVVNLQAYNAINPKSPWRLRIYIREYLARVKMFYDLMVYDADE